MILRMWLEGCLIEGTYEEFVRLFDLMLVDAVYCAGYIPNPS